MSYVLSIYEWLDWLDELSVQPWVHGTKQRELHGVRCGEVQDCHRRHFMCRVRRRQVPHHYRSYRSKRLRGMRRRQVPYIYWSFTRKLLCELCHQRLFGDACCYYKQHLFGLSNQLSIYEWVDWLDELSVQPWVHGSKRRELHGLREGEVQDYHWRRSMCRVWRRQVPRNYRSYSSKRLCVLQCGYVLFGGRCFCRHNLHQLQPQHVLYC
jgi:hypothetical protein